MVYVSLVKTKILQKIRKISFNIKNYQFIKKENERNNENKMQNNQTEINEMLIVY